MVSSQLSDAYNAPTEELESFLQGTSLHRFMKKLREASSVNLDKKNFAIIDPSLIDEDMTRYFNTSESQYCAEVFLYSYFTFF